MKKLNLIFVTFFGLGYFYKIPGTVTSLLITSLLFFFFEILKYENLNLICISFILIFFYSFYAVKVTEKKFTNKDPKEIVIDEALGQSLPIIYILYLNLNNEINIKIEIYYALSFFFFRFFDIFKPFPVNFYSFYAVKVTEKKFINKDPKEIVIDEALGQSLPIIYILYLNLNNEINIKIEIYYALSFFFFRFFDIFKPFPVNYFDQNFKNFFGIIMDDIIAGLYSIILIYLINLNFYEFKITS